MATAVVVATLLKAMPDLGVLIVWVLGWGLIVWAAKRPVQDAPNPAPPPPPERGSQEEPQVTVVRDTTHPNLWIVIQRSPWLDWKPEKENDDE